MKYLSLSILLLLISLPLADQIAYGQDYLKEIGKIFDNLTSGLLGNKEVNQSFTNTTNESSSSEFESSTNQSLLIKSLMK